MKVYQFQNFKNHIEKVIANNNNGNGLYIDTHVGNTVVSIAYTIEKYRWKYAITQAYHV